MHQLADNRSEGGHEQSCKPLGPVPIQVLLQKKFAKRIPLVRCRPRSIDLARETPKQREEVQRYPIVPRWERTPSVFIKAEEIPCKGDFILQILTLFRRFVFQELVRHIIFLRLFGNTLSSAQEELDCQITIEI